MNITDFLNRYSNDIRATELFSLLKTSNPKLIQADKLTGSMMGIFVSVCFHKMQRPQVVVLNDKESAAYTFNDLEQLIGKKDVFFFPASYRRPYEMEETDNANVLLRTEVLNRLTSRKRPPILVTYADALFEKVIRKKEFTNQSLVIKQGDKIGMDFLNDTLFEYKFERVDFVTEPGEFSIRGGIVDVFSFSNDQPYRIEFFDDEIETIRKFDVVTQLSIEKTNKAELIPNLEDKAILVQRESLFSFISSDAILWVQQPDMSIERLNDFYTKAEAAYSKLDQTVKRIAPKELFVTGKDFESELNNFSVVRSGGGRIPDATIHFGGKPQPAFQKNFDLLADTLQTNTLSGQKNYILFSSQPQADRLHAIFEDQGKKLQFEEVLATLHEGFEDPIAELVCYTDHQIFERYQRFKIKNGFDRKQAITLKELNSLQYGDYVTHIDHGVGIFGGLQKIEVNGKIQEAIKLVYRDNDVLYISIHSLHKISKFNSKDGTAPLIHKLGSPAWQNLKNKTKKKVKEIAFDLIQLYAKRKDAKGHAYAPDSYLQHELEASFMYEDTPDQVKATADVKQDMERQQPMDRLICGDVGFGKTEVAIRAAFKAATDGKQVAVLVPTTILAFQHFKSFGSRLADFPVKVDYINRFKKPAEIKRTLKELEEGKIDILIGTHRLVSKDVKFKDLGLLIIDEEQKFGVGVKDKIKTFRVNIDTLTLTATPIPRTLQFSLMAARDLSVMNTPPPNRQPIETQIIGFSEEIIRDSIAYEIQRGGQVFFINNRVENIREVAGMIQRLVPDARVGIGHGQMTGKELENTMLNFMEGRYDVLVATTIIESGLDVPNANTIIINNAHHFGLSDLHQMRGRVGRSTKKAFCKLIAPPISGLPDESRKRLQALEMFSDLGSGFKIALRDLEIRGAGDMLGAEQSGFITDMGFDAYQKILAEAVTELKETEFKDLYAHETKNGSFAADCQIDTDLPLLIPDDYVNNIEERLRLYQQLDGFEKVEDLENFKTSLHDRFGELPEQVEELIDSMRLRWTAKALGIERLILKQETLIAHLVSQSKTHYYESDTFTRILYFVKDHHRSVKMKQKVDKLTLRIEQVKTVKQAIALFEPLVEANVTLLEENAQQK